MNIVVLSHRVPYPPIKGEKIRTYHQLESLREAGCAVTVFSPLHERGDLELVEQFGAATGAQTFSAHAGKGWLRMLTGLFKGKSLSVAKFHVPGLQSQLNSYLAAHQVDILYCTSSAMAEYAFVAEQEFPNVRVIVDFMDLDSDKWERYSAVSSFPMSMVYRYESRTLGRYERRIQSSVEQCLFVSQAEADLYRNKNATDAPNLKVVGNGVELSEYYPAAYTGYREPLTLLFTGVMDYLPNEDAVCWFVENVWDTVTDNFPQAELVIAGMNPTQRILDMQKRDNITVTGFVDEMLPYYHSADIFIAPFQIARGVQNKILQAFACGLPVVTTPLGAEGIDGNDGAHYLMAETPRDFAQKIDNLIHQPELYDSIAESARRLISEDYRWEAKNRPLVELVMGGASNAV